MRLVPRQRRPLTERLGRIVDATVGIFSPRKAFERQAWRDGFRAQYEAASRERPRTSWLGASASADADIIPHLSEIRDKSRDLFQNDGAANAIEVALLDNVIGTGIMPQSRIDWEAIPGMTDEQALNLGREFERRFACWCKNASSDHRLTFPELQAQALSQVVMNGDVFALPLMIDPTTPGEEHREYSLAVELVEADRCDDPQGLKRDPKFKDKNIRGGVELGERGQPVAYWISKSHPGDAQFENQPGKRAFDRYPARTLGGRPGVLHLYQQKRPGQTRGIPLLTPVLNEFKDIKDWKEAEIIGAKIASCFVVAIETGGDPGVAARNRATGVDPGNGDREQEIGPGRIDYLRPGEKLSTATPGRPNPMFEPFYDRALISVGSAMGLSYEILTRDFRKTTYLSARASILEVLKSVRRWQYFFRARFNQPLWEMFLEELYLRGVVPGMPDFYEHRQALTRARWIAPGRGMIDPEKEIAAQRAAVDANFTTQADACAEMNGSDWEETAEQRSREKKRMEELDVVPPAAPGSAPKPEEQKKAPGDGAPKNDSNPADEPQDAEEAARLAETNAR